MKIRFFVPGFQIAHAGRDAMIHWEAPPHVVGCSNCGSSDTQVSFEFLLFTRRICRTCGLAFVTITDPSSRDRVFTFRFKRLSTHAHKPE